MRGAAAPQTTPGVPSPRCFFGVLILAAGIVASAPPAPPTSEVRAAAVQLTTGNSPLGDGVALILGASGVPTPSHYYVDAANTLYLQPLGFTGTPQVLTTPEWTYATDTTEQLGAQILTAAIQRQIAVGQVDAANPVTVFGYSQSSAFATFTMQQLHDQGVPSDYVHFVLVGDSAVPNGGILTAFDIPPGTNVNLSAFDLTLGNPTPSDLYPADVYTLEYDGYADFPRYPLNMASLLNALIGLFTQHVTYLYLDPEQITNAIQLETTADSLVNYYMIPSDSLPLLTPLLQIPTIGQPLYDLLEPDMRIMVNLGYGSIDEGWNSGPANVETPVGLFPTDLNWGDVFTALVNGASSGIQAFSEDLAGLA